MPRLKRPYIRRTFMQRDRNEYAPSIIEIGERERAIILAGFQATGWNGNKLCVQSGVNRRAVTHFLKDGKLSLINGGKIALSIAIELAFTKGKIWE